MSSRSLHEWSRFLDATSGEEATAALSRRVAELDGLYDEVAALVPGLYNCPDSDIPTALAWARSSISEAAGMLADVKVRFNNADDVGAA